MWAWKPTRSGVGQCGHAGGRSGFSGWFGQRGLLLPRPERVRQSCNKALPEPSETIQMPILIVLLVDERPEEVTDFRRQVPDAEVIASTFDESAESHVHAAEIVIEKARRMVEHQQHVVILLDSITRLPVLTIPPCRTVGKFLVVGLRLLPYNVPRDFSAQPVISRGGSLTILGTALVETGSKMDEVIFEEFKGTGNMELHLDRELSNKRIFPALILKKVVHERRNCSITPMNLVRYTHCVAP